MLKPVCDRCDVNLPRRQTSHSNRIMEGDRKLIINVSAQDGDDLRTQLDLCYDCVQDLLICAFRLNPRKKHCFWKSQDTELPFYEKKKVNGA